MTAIKTFFSELWLSMYTLLSSVNILTSVIDILLVALVVFALIRLIRDSRAEQLFKGILLLVVAFGVATVLRLKTLLFLLNILFDNALILVVVIFQPEIRRALEQAGSSRFGILRTLGMDREEMVKAWKQAIAATVKAVADLQEQRAGALLVFERQTKLGDIVTSGTLLEAQPSAELLGNIFFKNTPLHDGAVILREGRVCAAGCILPLTDLQIGTSMGTRHRAAVGMSENSDAVVVVVSEETGTISIAQGGTLRRDFTPEELKAELESAMLAALQKDEPQDKKRRFIRRKEGK
ncbi:MAG: TIGR00159 family protein [Ruminococcaceae bacterium]|nr:TIGR00159 family protein [Oscillospiraceae bacterium]